MTNQLGWFTARELAGLPGMPGTERAIQIRGKAEWNGRKRAGSKAIEYCLVDLPAETQAEILARSVAESNGNLPADMSAEKVEPYEADGSSRLNEKQRSVMLARLAFCREIERLAEFVSQKTAINMLLKHAEDGQLSPYLQDRIEIANDRKTESRGLSERTLKRWLSSWRAAGRDEMALAPLRQRASLDVPDWAGAFLRCYQRPTKPSVAASYAEFSGTWTGDLPSIHAVQRFLKKLSPDALNVGRMAGSKKTPAKWEAQLANTVSRAYACKALFASGIGRWNFIGEMAEVAGYTMTVLLRQVRQARRDFTLNKLQRCKQATKVRRADVFCEAWVHAVHEQVAAFAGATLSPAVEQYLAHHYPDLVQQKPRDRNATTRRKAGVRAINDAMHGLLAAADVRLNHGMTTAAPLALTQVAS